MRTWMNVVVGLLAVIGLGLAQTVHAYELVDEDSYRLGVGEVVDNDLYITAETITIDGTVRGDLVALARVIEINGTVEGDLIAAAGSIIINGTIGDDVRVGANGIRIAGSIGDDLIAAFGGGDAMTQLPFDTGPAMSGLALTTDGQVGGSLLLFGGAADLLGRVQGDVQAAVGVLTLAGKVAGDVQAQVGELRIADNARVAGALAYTAEREMPIPPGSVEGGVRFTLAEPESGQPDQQGDGFLGGLVALGLRLIGFALLALLLLRFVPDSIGKPAGALAARPLNAVLYGLVVAVSFVLIPIATLVIAGLLGVFMGGLAGVMAAILVFALFTLIWILSPLVTGLWLGQRLNTITGREQGDLVGLIGGILLLATLSAIPLAGWVIALASFLLALGGLLLVRQSNYLSLVAA